MADDEPELADIAAVATGLGFLGLVLVATASFGAIVSGSVADYYGIVLYHDSGWAEAVIVLGISVSLLSGGLLIHTVDRVLSEGGLW